MSNKTVLTRSKKQKALALLQSGQLVAARDLYVSVCRTDARDAQAWCALGVVHGMLGLFQESITCCRRAVILQPDYIDAHINQGISLKSLGRLDAALVCYQAALRLDPAASAIHLYLGNTLAELGRAQEALAYYQEALRLGPNNPETHNNMGVALKSLGRMDEALACYQEALRLDCDFTNALGNLGNIFAHQGRLQEASSAYERALQRAPDAEVHSNLGKVLLAQGQLEPACVQYRAALSLAPAHAEAHSNLLFAMNYAATQDPDALFAEHQRWGELHAQTSVPADFTCPRDSERRLKIGYVSPDLRKHSVAYFMESLLATHDPSQVEVFCYAHVELSDEITQSLKGRVEHWRNIWGMANSPVAETIRADGIDILVDLAGHTAHNRLGVFVLRPAPVQVSYLGYPNTTGLPQMDYRLTDAWADPPGQAPCHTETLVRLPRGFLCYTPPRAAPAVDTLPLARAGHVTFGSFNALPKIGPTVIALWARLLQAIPDARLILKNTSLRDAATREHYARLFQDHGIAPQRLEWVAWLPASADHLALYNRVDIGLDTFPYNGTTTTCEALWMGVPVVVLAGSRHAGRVGVSLLERMGLAELIAQTPEQYIELAVRLAADCNRIGHLRTHLRARMLQSPLCDARAHSQDIEAAYRQMWQRWCAQSKPVGKV